MLSACETLQGFSHDEDDKIIKMLSACETLQGFSHDEDER